MTPQEYNLARLEAAEGLRPHPDSETGEPSPETASRLASLFCPWLASEFRAGTKEYVQELQEMFLAEGLETEIRCDYGWHYVVPIEPKTVASYPETVASTTAPRETQK